MSTHEEAAAKAIASQKASEIQDKAVKAKIEDKDPGKGFTFLSGKKLPTGFINPPAGKPFHRCVDHNGIYHPDWVSMRAHKTDSTQPDRIYVHCGVIRGPNKAATQVNNFVLSGVWLDAPQAVFDVVSQAMRETVDMVTTDQDGNKLGLTGPSARFEVVEERPQFNCEIRASA